MTKTIWISTSAATTYVPREKPIQESLAPFSSTFSGAVPSTQIRADNTGQRILAIDGTWIPQPAFTAGGSDQIETLRPSVLSTAYSAGTPLVVTDPAKAYDVDTNHATTFGQWYAPPESRSANRVDIFSLTTWGSKTETWTAATINVSRSYAVLQDGESATSSKTSSVKYEFSTNNGSTWTTLGTDTAASIPTAPQTLSMALGTLTPTMGNILVKVTITRGGGGTIFEDGVSLPGLTGEVDLKLFDVWIDGTYAGGAGNITCNDLTVTGDATFQNKIYDSTTSSGTTGQVLKVAANGKVTWATDSAGSGTVTSITTTGANGITISGGSTQTITTSGTFALALGNITPTSISTGTGSFTGDVEFAASIKSPNGSNSPVTIVPDGTGDLHVNADSLRLGDNNANATIATNGTGDLILTTHEGSAVEGVIRLYDGADGNITLTPNGTGQVQVGSDQVVTLTASQTLTNKSLTSPTLTTPALGTPSSGTLTNCTFPTLNQNTTGNAATASALQTARNINGVSFNGTADITVTAAANTLTGTTLASGVTASSLTSIGTLGSLTVSGTTSLATSSGNVGIGTSSPTQKIMLGGQTGATSTPLALQFSADWSNGYVAEKCKIYLYNGGGTGLWGFAIGPDNDIQYHSGGAGNTNGQHKWYTGNTETMRLNASGNLGVGVTPATKLDVNGVITLRDSSLTGSGRAEITSTAFVGITMASGNYVFNNATNTTEYARLTSTGLGIGTNSPAQKLDINGKIRFTPNTADTNYSADIYANYNSAHPFQLDVKNNGSIAEYLGVYADGGGSNNRVVFPTGNVGIGITSPSAKLSIYKGSAGVLATLQGGGTACGFAQGVVGGANTFEIQTQDTTTGTLATRYLIRGSTDNANHEWYAGARGSETVKMFLDSTTGNLGIGTSSPTNKLQVNGVMVGNNASGSYTKGFGGILTTTSTSTPTGGSSGDFALIY